MQNIPTHFIEQFASTFTLLVQQTEHRLCQFAMQGSHKGEGAAPVDQIGLIELAPVTMRLQPSLPSDLPTDRRWVYPKDFARAVYVDHFDKLRLMNDPTNDYMRSLVNAAHRKMDDEFISAIFADAKTGKTGSTTTSFPSSQEVGVNIGGTGSGLNFSKLRAAREILMGNDVDPDEQLYCAITANEMSDLLNEPQLTSRDFVTFGGMSPVESGRIMRAQGFTFIESQRLVNNASSQRQVPVWSKLGMHFGNWEGLRATMIQDPSIVGNPYKCEVQSTFGATRVEEKRVVRILCA